MALIRLTLKSTDTASAKVSGDPANSITARHHRKNEGIPNILGILATCSTLFPTNRAFVIVFARNCMVLMACFFLMIFLIKINTNVFVFLIFCKMKLQMYTDYCLMKRIQSWNIISICYRFTCKLPYFSISWRKLIWDWVSNNIFSITLTVLKTHLLETYWLVILVSIWLHKIWFSLLISPKLVYLLTWYTNNLLNRLFFLNSQETIPQIRCLSIVQIFKTFPENWDSKAPSVRTLVAYLETTA